MTEPLRNLLADPDDAAVERTWRRIAEQRMRPASRTRVWIPALAVAAAAVVALVVWWPSRSTTVLELVGGEPFAPIETTEAARDVALSDGSRIVVEPRTRLGVAENTGASVRLTLDRGRVDVRVQPGGPRRWAVDCGDVLVEVTGTRFIVDRAVSQIAVRVTEGRVRVTSAFLPAGTVELGAGESVAIQAPVVAQAPSEPPTAATTIAATQPERPSDPDASAKREVATTTVATRRASDPDVGAKREVVTTTAATVGAKRDVASSQAATKPDRTSDPVGTKRGAATATATSQSSDPEVGTKRDAATATPTKRPSEATTTKPERASDPIGTRRDAATATPTKRPSEAATTKPERASDPVGTKRDATATTPTKRPSEATTMKPEVGTKRDAATATATNQSSDPDVGAKRDATAATRTKRASEATTTNPERASDPPVRVKPDAAAAGSSSKPVRVTENPTAQPTDAPVPTWRDHVRRGDHRAAFALLGVDGIAREAAATTTVDDLVGLSDIARLSGHPRSAIAPLERASQLGSAAAAYSLGRLLLDQLGDPGGAATAFEAAIRRGLPASLDETAHARVVEAHARAGHRDAAVRWADVYAQRFPHGSQRDAVRRWSGQR